MKSNNFVCFIFEGKRLSLNSQSLLSLYLSLGPGTYTFNYGLQIEKIRYEQP
jgi:hypothetical protein